MSEPRKLYKIDKGRKIDGVCGGIAEFLNIDPTIVRLVWILFAACAFAGVVAYFIAALVMPRKADVM